MDNEDFEHQLLLEAKEKALKEKSEQENPYLTRDPNDGTLYEYDPDKKAWFPKIDETFMAYYQQYNYQYVEPDKPTEDKRKDESTKRKDESNKRKDESNKQSTDQQSSMSREQQKQNKESQSKEKPKPEWFSLDEDRSTKVYISNLPDEITEEEFVELMQKCGLILKDTETNQFKIKLYKDAEGKLKGDGLCTYIKPESVTLALQILDGYLYKDRTLKVERAKFELRGEFQTNIN